MLRIEAHLEDLHIVAERDIKEKGVWTVNVSDTFDQKFQVVSFTDVQVGFLMLLASAGDDDEARSAVPTAIQKEFDELFTEVRPYP